MHQTDRKIPQVTSDGIQEASASRAAPDRVAVTTCRRSLARQLDTYLDSFGQSWGDAYRFSGAVLVAEGDDWVYARGFGPGSSEYGVDTTFRIGSVTKQFTAAAILVLVQQKRLSLEGTVGEYLPWYRGPASSVSLHALLSHTGGVPEYNDAPAFRASRAKPRTPRELVNLFSKEALDFEPGTEFRYSNAGYVLLGAILEEVTGLSYAQVLQWYLLTPAGMTDTGTGDDVGGAVRAAGFKVVANQRVPAELIALENAYAAGGLRSTLRDLWRWDHALRQGKLLDHERLALFFTTVQESYAYGWRVFETPLGRVAAHDGGIDGFVTSYARGLDQDFMIAAWSNTDLQQPPQILAAALDLLIGKPVQTRDELPEGTFNSRTASRYLGTYGLPREEVLRLKARGLSPQALKALEQVQVLALTDCLVFRRLDRDDVYLFASHDGGYFSKKAPLMRVRFVRGRAGGVQLRIQQGKAHAVLVRH